MITIEQEKEALSRYIQGIRDAGWKPVSVFDTEESIDVTNKTSDEITVEAAQTELSYIHFEQGEDVIKKRAMIMVVWGNGAADELIADCSVAHDFPALITKLSDKETV